MKVVVVLPTLNEVETIGEVLRRIREAVPDAEALVVDDASPDGTADRAEEVGREINGVHVLRRDGRHGFAAAYRSGFAWALEHGAEAVVEMDSDLSHDPAALPSLLDALAVSDLVIGSRYVAGGSVPRWALHRRLLSRAGNWYSSLLIGGRVRDLTSGYRVYRAELLRSIDLDGVVADGYGFQIEMTYRTAEVGGRIREVPIRFVDREVGQSKMSGAIVVEALWLVTRYNARWTWARLRAIGTGRNGPPGPGRHRGAGR